MLLPCSLVGTGVAKLFMVSMGRVTCVALENSGIDSDRKLSVKQFLGAVNLKVHHKEKRIIIKCMNCLWYIARL